MNCPAIHLNAPEKRQYTPFVIIVLALTGCSASVSPSGSAGGDPVSRMEEPACYREAKSSYEAAGTSSDPNAALVNIGAALSARDSVFDRCTPARDLKQTQ
jgi:hypothetical protein